MLGGRRRLPVLGEIAVPGEGEGPWSLRSEDLQTLEDVRERLGSRRVLLVTATGGGAAALAIGVAGAAAAAGQGTVLLDCDLERSALAGELGLAPSPGVHEYLRWEATPQEVLQPLALAGPASAGAGEPLAFIAAGRPAADAATLLGLQSFRHMGGKLRRAYELVVIAGPPLDRPAAPLAPLAAQADAVVVAIDPGAAGPQRRRDVKGLGVKPLGAVVVSA